MNTRMLLILGGASRFQTGLRTPIWALLVYAWVPRLFVAHQFFALFYGYWYPRIFYEQIPSAEPFACALRARGTRSYCTACRISTSSYEHVRCDTVCRFDDGIWFLVALWFARTRALYLGTPRTRARVSAYHLGPVFYWTFGLT